MCACMCVFAAMNEDQRAVVIVFSFVVCVYVCLCVCVCVCVQQCVLVCGVLAKAFFAYDVSMPW